jgi:lipid-binding SYLF domain-containing protein
VDAPTRQEARVADAKAEEVLARLRSEIGGADKLLSSAEGVLVFPGVIEGAFWGGLQYGEGVLLIGGRSVDYYNLAAASFGVKFGAQKKDFVLVFMNKQALESFRDSDGWQVGLDGTVALVTVGAEGSINSETLNQPILAFVLGQRGLMAGFSLAGTKITRRDSPPEVREAVVVPSRRPAPPRKPKVTTRPLTPPMELEQQY